VEWSGGIAKNATVDYIYVAENDLSQGVFDSMVYAITTYKVGGAVVPSIGVSYGDCEYHAANPGITEGKYGSYSSYDTFLEEAAGQGQTIVISSGDDGAGCSDNTTNLDIADHGASVSWPASSPNVTAVGGTTFDGDGTAANPDTCADPPYWSSGSCPNVTGADVVNSALAYIPETTWNDSVTDEELSSSGGGVSILYPQPSWQNGLISGQSSGRMVPDISFTASADHDGYLICTQNFTSTTNPADTTGSSCVDGFRISAGGDLTPYGGTSAAAQVFSGMMTLLVQASGPQGNINTKLYSLAKTNAEVFHDITSGNNMVPCSAGKLLCVGGEVGYSATTGYDLATGLGSIDGFALYKALGGPSLTASTTTLSVMPTAPLVGESVTLTATVASASSAVTTTPSGTVTFTIDGVAGSAIALSGGTASTVTSFSTAGTHTVAIAYSGDSMFAASSASGSVTVTVVTLPTTTTTVTAIPTSIPLGSTTATQSFTATVAATGGGTTPAGTVAFAVNGVAVGTAALSGSIATLTGVAPTTANGFAVGSDTITAVYTPSATYAGSSGTTRLTVTAPAYTITPSASAVTLSQGGSQGMTVTFASTTFAGTVSWTATTSSPLITVSPASGTTTLAANGSFAVPLTITASSSAANHAPALPWSGGVIAFGAVLAGVPLLRRRKRVAAVLVAALAVSALGFMMSCSGGSSSAAAARSYTVTIAGSDGISSTISVTVP
jgi:hypothetical protein